MLRAAMQRRYAIALFAACMGASVAACSQEPGMNASPNAPDAVKAAAAQHAGWDPADVQVGQVEGLDRGGCRFYRASNPSRTDAAPIEYATLPDGTLVGGDAAQARERIGAVLQSCGRGAPATWWAQVVSRYAGSGGVLVDENAGSAIRRLREAGIQDHAPQLRSDGPATVLVYYTHDYERGRTQEVTATLDAGGRLSVQSRGIGGG